MGKNRSLQCCKQGNVNSKIKVVCKRSFLSSMGNGLTRSMDGDKEHGWRHLALLSLLSSSNHSYHHKSDDR